MGALWFLNRDDTIPRPLNIKPPNHGVNHKIIENEILSIINILIS